LNLLLINKERCGAAQFLAGYSDLKIAVSRGSLLNRYGK
jgi:hypothetical protein